MKQVKAVILDWAGTTVDYGCMAPVKAFVGGFAAIGVPITTEMARGPMGMAKIDHVRAITAMQDMPLSEEEILKAYAAFEALLFRDIENHCDIKPHVLKAVSVLRERKIRIGSTTGYTAAMMEKVVPAAALQGYSPDFCVTPEEAVKGRPYPYMIWENMKHFGLADPREVVKVGDTVADMEEGRNANCWTVGVILGSSELGLGAGKSCG
jgi:phosphonoacetaldehyde hydrolase